jgi:hypothetical protein
MTGNAGEDVGTRPDHVSLTVSRHALRITGIALVILIVAVGAFAIGRITGPSHHLSSKPSRVSHSKVVRPVPPLVPIPHTPTPVPRTFTPKQQPIGLLPCTHNKVLASC